MVIFTVTVVTNQSVICWREYLKKSNSHFFEQSLNCFGIEKYL